MTINDVQLRNTTVASNVGSGVQTSGVGADPSDLHLNYVTIAGNTTGVASGGVDTVTLSRSLVATNGTDCSGSVAMAAFNLVGIQDPGCTLPGMSMSNDIVGTPAAPVDPLLTALADNGGAAETMALASASPAIDTGGTPATACLPIDQRGTSRPQGPACDIGAFELVPAVGPTTLVVDRNVTCSDTPTTEPYCTVAAAVAAASSGDTVAVAAGTYPETTVISAINKDLTIVGAGSGLTVVDATAVGFRAMQLWGDATYAVSALTITGGNSGPSLGGGVSLAGYNGSAAPTVVMTDVEIIGNSSTSSGGGIENNGATLTLDSSDVINNTSGGNGGGIYNYNGATLTVIDTAVSGNSANDGAGVYITDSASFSGITFSDNDASGNGGALYANMGIQPFSVTDSTFSGNTAGTYGGAVLTISGDAQFANTTFDGNSALIGGAVYDDFVSTFTDSSMTNNTAGDTGGAIHSDSNLTVVRSTLDGNTAGLGGGIFNNILSTTVVESTISNNTATAAAIAGGGIGGAGLITVSNSTISGNQATAGDGGGVGALGNTLVTMDFVTVAGNSAAGAGGAIFGQPGDPIEGQPEGPVLYPKQRVRVQPERHGVHRLWTVGIAWL